MAKPKQKTPKATRKIENTEDSFQRHWDETEEKHWNDLDPLSHLTPAQREQFLKELRREFIERNKPSLKPPDTNSPEDITSLTKEQ